MELLFNAAKLKQTFPKSITHYAIVYVEGIDNESQRYFDKYGVKSVKPFKMFSLEDDPRYVFVGCDLLKSELDKFNQALYDMQTQMLILGYPDYEEFCKKSFKRLHVTK